MSHDSLVFIAKTFGLIWLMGFFMIVVVLAYRPSARAGHDRAARSILPPEPEERR
ncbi:MAG: CcoQ/FixQ family Cbb3-type cytochrome c oxidase assembly chaperone [Alphaproteobacteria bacterium HGW-Alphaproteobacteria-6]|nr:MAG: CcoQ/FixQ family Cbb3-type cytochrome c oxidase assembly chaperone [Alphaproteobacteria bacterium HGW-Alphaproteobacteria-6]